jgi:hypothetical protein
MLMMRLNYALVMVGAVLSYLMLWQAPGWAGGSGMCMVGAVPEPASGAILAAGVAGILWYRRRRTRR